MRLAYYNRLNQLIQSKCLNLNRRQEILFFIYSWNFVMGEIWNSKEFII